MVRQLRLQVRAQDRKRTIYSSQCITLVAALKFGVREERYLGAVLLFKGSGLLLLLLLLSPRLAVVIDVHGCSVERSQVYSRI